MALARRQNLHPPPPARQPLSQTRRMHTRTSDDATVALAVHASASATGRRSFVRARTFLSLISDAPGKRFSPHVAPVDPRVCDFLLVEVHLFSRIIDIIIILFYN